MTVSSVRAERVRFWGAYHIDLSISDATPCTSCILVRLYVYLTHQSKAMRRNAR